MRLINLMNLLNQNTQSKKEIKSTDSKNAKRLLKKRQKVLNGFERKIFQTAKQTQGKRIKILTPKQML